MDPDQIQSNIDQQLQEGPSELPPSSTSSPNIIEELIQNCPQPGKDLLLSAKEDGDLNPLKIVLEDLKFPKRATGNNFCSHFFHPHTEQYYVCQQCSYHSSSFSTMCFCQGCWEPEKHIGHNFYSQAPYSDGAYCDCGRIDRIKKSSFCSNHSTFDIEIPCEIAEEERKAFIGSFVALIEVSFLKQNDQILKNVCNYLEILNENSVFYNRLTFDLLTTPSNSVKYGNQKYLQILLKKVDISKFLIHLGGDLKTRMNVVKLVCEDSGDGENMAQQLGSSSIKELFNLTTVEKLLDSGFYHQSLLNAVENADNCKDKLRLLSKIMMNKLTAATNLAQLSALNNSQISPELAELILHKVCQLYPSSEKIKSFITCSDNESNPWGEFQQIKSKEENHENLPYDVRNAHTTIAGCLFIIFSVKKHRFGDFRSYLLEKGLDSSKLEEILYWITLSAREICFGDEEKVSMIPILLLIIESPSRDLLLDRFWRSLLCIENLNHEEPPIKDLVNSFHYIVVTMLRADILTLINQKKIAKLFSIKITQEQNGPQEKEALQNWFRSFLYERKAISRSQVIQLKSKGVLSFEGAGKVLNDLCSYDQEQQMFNFSYNKTFKNILSQFPLMPSLEAYESIYSNNICFGQQIHLQQQTISNFLVKNALNTKAIIEAASTSWQASVSKQQFAEGEEKYGYLYLFLLVVYDALTKGKDQSVRETLNQIKSKPEAINEYTSFDQEKEKIRRLLGVNQKLEEAQNQNKQGNKSTNKMRSMMKKKQLEEKYSKQRNLILERVKSLNQGIVNEEEQLCILCHEREKKGNELVYLSTLLKNNTIAGAIHGKNNISNTFISTCFHPVHVNCYISFRKNSQGAFNCPLCQATSNCILPTMYKRESLKLNRICKNVMIANMVTAHQIYDVESDFILLFKHLVESKGLNSLLLYTRYQQKKKSWIRIDEFLKNLMVSIYKTSHEEKQKEHLNSIEEFILQIDLCPKPECLLVQLLFAESLKQILTQVNSEDKISKFLVKLRALLQEDEFMIINQQVCRLLQRDLKLPDPGADEVQQKKCRLSFELVRLPEQAVQCRSRYEGKQCNNCEQKNEYLCLLCDKLVCQECRGGHSKNEHNETSIYLSTSSLKVELARKNFYTNDDVYENEFKVTYSEKGDYEDMGEEQDYLLNDIKLLKLVSKFLDN